MAREEVSMTDVERSRLSAEHHLRWRLLPRLFVIVLLLAVVSGQGSRSFADESEAITTPGESGDPVGANAGVIIRNVHIVSRGEAARDELVHLIILGGKLKVVTRDSIPGGTARMIVDGSEGFLLGTLNLGEPPGFVILDQSPRDDINVLLDTKDHVLFAMENGSVVLNDLPTEVIPEDAQAPPALRWSAYSPPPIAVPLRSFDSRKWNRFDTSYVSGFFNGALVLDRLEWLSQDEASESQVGDLDSSEVGEIRAFRMGVVGRIKFPKPWIYTVYVATRTFDRGFESTTDNSLVWYDYRLDIPVSRYLNLSLGKQKEPISMERLMPLTFLPQQERSLANDTLLPARNFGIVLSGTTSSQRWTWAGSVFRNFIDADTSYSDTPTQLVGRATWLPFASSDDSHLFHLGIAYRYTNDPIQPRYGSVPEFNQAPLFLETETLALDNSSIVNVEAYWRLGPYWLGFEYTSAELDMHGTDESSAGGFQVVGSWALTGEMRAYRKTNGTFGALPVARSVDHGGWGALELSFRYSTLDLSEEGLAGGEMDIFSLGLNWWLTQSNQLSLNARSIELDRFDLRGRSTGLNLRMILVLD